MIAGRLAFVAVVVALAVAAVPGIARSADECNGIPRCIPVEGPWVAVPAHGEISFSLECPNGGKGVVAGTDGRASSLDIRATFDGILGSPVAFGRTTHTAALFRVVSAHHRAGAFKPFIGCIPAPNAFRITYAGQLLPTGPPLGYKAMLVPLTPGLQKVVTLSCPSGQTLVDSWSATAFTTPGPPPRGVADAISVKSKIVNGKVQLSIFASEALPVAASAEIQLGVRCASG